MIGCFHSRSIAAVAQQYVSYMDRDTLFLWLWLIWLAILVIGIAYVLLSGVHSWL